MLDSNHERRRWCCLSSRFLSRSTASCSFFVRATGAAGDDSAVAAATGDDSVGDTAATGDDAGGDAAAGDWIKAEDKESGEACGKTDGDTLDRGSASSPSFKGVLSPAHHSEER